MTTTIVITRMTLSVNNNNPIPNSNLVIWAEIRDRLCPAIPYKFLGNDMSDIADWRRTATVICDSHFRR